MPIIVLRDHATFAPLDLASAGADRHVDAALIAAEARRMLPPGQTLVAPAGTHNLHEHEHLAAAALLGRGAWRPWWRVAAAAAFLVARGRDPAR